jgi:tetratricopeptide (TPR) repeat protein
MAATSESKDRQVVPRWRMFREARAAHELGNPSAKAEGKMDVAPFLRQKEMDWQENKAIPFALDLVSAATVLGTTPSSLEAAEFLLENGGRTSETGRELARALLGIKAEEEPLIMPQTRIQIIQGVKQLKQKRIDQSRNAFVWVDLARLYTLLGQNLQARQALTIALKLAPSDRFVLRCTARFLHHIGEYGEALDLLRKNGRTPHDPWLMAAEIAASEVAEKGSRFAKLGAEILAKKDVNAFHTSELASALAGVEMNAGKNRNANKLFRQSLITPTPNALAQAVWACKRTGLGQVNPNVIAQAQASEALTLDHFNKQEWEKVMSEAERWTQEEGFSARPPGLASCVATSFLDKPELGEAIAEKGLATNPRHPALTNNKAFSQIVGGKAADGMLTLAEIDPTAVGKRERICLLATTGLAYFRLGNAKEGRRFYQTAIELATELEELGLRTLGCLYLAREEAARGNKQAFTDFKRAYEVAGKLQQTNIPALAERLAKDVEAAAERHHMNIEIRKQRKPILVERDFVLRGEDSNRTSKG